jgi:plasmid stability protein
MEGRMAKTTVDLPEGLHRTLRVKAALEQRSMNEIVLEALQAYLQEFRLTPELLEVETVAREPSGMRVSTRRGSHE